MKRNFVRFISHEIRTPLNTVSMGLQLVISDMEEKIASNSLNREQTTTDPVVIVNELINDTKTRLNMVKQSNESCEIAIDILNDILTYDKLDSKDLVLHTTCTTVGNLVCNNCKGFENQVGYYVSVH